MKFTQLILPGMLLLGVSTANAQTTDITVDIAKAKLTWNWQQGTGGAVEKFLVRCGKTTGLYDSITTLADPLARSVPLTLVAPTVGVYYCAVSATNTFGTSPISNEVKFSAGKTPAGATEFKVEAQ